MRKRLMDYGFKIGRFDRGKRNLITDVKGVKVGNYTLMSDEGGFFRTGVTVVFPHNENIYEKPVFSSVFVLNGYGKSTGLIQIEELGTLETPIFITSTLNVGKVWDAAVEYMLSFGDIKSINPVVLECNDIRVNEAEKRPLGKEEVFRAIENADEIFQLGNIGAGTGMVTFGYKGGLGSSSRIVGQHTIGVLVVSNFGRREDLIGGNNGISGNPGSIIVIIATDAPLIPKQLKRLGVRGALGISKAGGRANHKSGDIILAFSIAYMLARKNEIQITYIPDDSKTMQDLMDAVIDCVVESIYDALLTAESMVGRDGEVYESIEPDIIFRRLSSL